MKSSKMFDSSNGKERDRKPSISSAEQCYRGFRANAGIPVVQSFTPFLRYHNYEIKPFEYLDIEFIGTDV